MNLITNALTFAQLIGADQATPYGPTCLEQGKEMAEILSELNVDDSTLAATLIYSCTQYADLSIEDIADHLGEKISKLIQRTKQMDSISELYAAASIQQQYPKIDNIRKMLLAMVNDIRAVLIKLAECLFMLRYCKNLPPTKQRQIAEEVGAIYAPLANRLGIWQIKWQLEDLSFRYLNPAEYKKISTTLNQRRVEREEYIASFKSTLKIMLEEASTDDIEVSGRPKHIYRVIS